MSSPQRVYRLVIYYVASVLVCLLVCLLNSTVCPTFLSLASVLPINCELMRRPLKMCHRYEITPKDLSLLFPVPPGYPDGIRRGRRRGLPRGSLSTATLWPKVVMATQRCSLGN